MIDRRWEAWAEREAGMGAAWEAADGDPFKILSLLIRRSGGKATFDGGRDITKGCTFCGTKKRPRELVTIGRYLNGRSLTRPVCERCMPIAEAVRMKPEAVLRKGWEWP